MAFEASTGRSSESAPPTAQAKRFPPEKIVWEGEYPLPPAPQRRPLHALISAVRLVRNKDDIKQVFETVSASSGKSGHRLFKKLVATPYGRRIVNNEFQVEDYLTDHERLSRLPEDSLGRAYFNFMRAENLSADKIIAAAQQAGTDLKGERQFEAYSRMCIHLDLCHDLWHVLTGYGQDALGEICNVAFTNGQANNPGFKLIVTTGLLAQKLERPFAPLGKAVKEAYLMGEGVDFFLQHDIREMLPQPIDAVRRKLNFIEPRIYKSIPDEVKNNLMLPRGRQAQPKTRSV